MQTLNEWDVFISHASEDKDDVARPLAKALDEMGLRVWFDEFTLRAGDSLTKSINYGLQNSKYGIVIISDSFLTKKWTQRELNGLFAKEEEVKVIIPVWHGVTEKKVRSFYPILADLVALKSTTKIDVLVKDLLRAMNLPFMGADLTGMWFGRTGRMRLFKIGELIEGDYDWNGRDWCAHLRGKLTKTTFVFDWWWDFTLERGGGFFNFENDILEGEWWMGQEADGRPILRNNHKRKSNVWGYQRISSRNKSKVK